MNQPSVELSSDQVAFLKTFKKQASRSLREINRANILLLLDKGKKAIEIADFLDVGRNTVSRTKGKFLRKGLEAALGEQDRPGQPQKYTQTEQAEVIALACSDPPEGRQRWTLQLLTKEARKRAGLEGISQESVRLMLKKTNVNLG